MGFRLVKELAADVDGHGPSSEVLSTSAAATPQDAQTRGSCLPPLTSRASAPTVQNLTLRSFLETLRVDYQLDPSASRSQRQKFLETDLRAAEKSLICQFFLRYCKLLDGNVVVFGKSLEHLFLDAGRIYDATLVSDITGKQNVTTSTSASSWTAWRQLLRSLTASTARSP